MRTTPLAALIIIAATAITGCSVKKEFYARDGSRADGTIDLAYDFRQFEQPVVDRGQALALAKRKCSVWGYSDAEPFGGAEQICNRRDGFGACIEGIMVSKYQCLGNLDAPAPSTLPSAASHQSSTPSGALSKAQWQQQQLQQLEQEKGLSYEEYSRRYRQIMAQ